MTIRQAIVSDLIGKLQTIRTVNGYLTNAGINVKHWATAVQPVEGDVILNVRDTTSEMVAGKYDAHEFTLSIQIEFGCVAGTETYNTLMKVLEDVYSCIRENEEWFKQKYQQMWLLPGEGESIEVYEEDRIAGEGKLGIAVRYVGERWRN